MLHNHEELSPDLEWMLQSDQVSSETLVQALADKYYLQIYRKALSNLSYPDEARYIARETIIQAVLESTSYRGAESVSEWLDEISNLKIAERKKQIRSQQMLNPRLIRSMSKAGEWEMLSPGVINGDILEINEGIKKQAGRKSKRITTQVLGLLGMITLVVVIMVGSQFYWSPEVAEETTEISTVPAVQQTSIPPTPTPVENKAEEISQLPKPLTLNATSPEIRGRIRSSTEYWDTMWAEVLVTFYGPEGYDGPPIQERHQFWINPDEGGMLVSGSLDEFPNFIKRFNIPGTVEIGGQVFGADLFTEIGSEIPWYVLSLETLLKMPHVLNFMRESSFGDGQFSISYGVMGEEEWSGIKTLSIELIADGIWVGDINIDPLTGIALRERYYDHGSDRITLIETSVSEIQFDQPMPDEWKPYDYASLAYRYFPSELSSLESGENEKPEIDLPLSRRNFNLVDPSQSKLFFTKSGINTGDSDGLANYGVFAEETYLGSIDLIDPLRMICDRSPGGNQIAFADWNFSPPVEENKIYWFSLDQLELSSIELPPMAIHWIGFSPDERYLGFSGITEAEGISRISILDTEQGIVRMLPISANFNRITWNPDGTQILILEEEGSSFEGGIKPSLRVYSAEDGELIERIEVEDFSTYQNSIRIPLEGWTAEFQTAIQDITSCTAAPGG